MKHVRLSFERKGGRRHEEKNPKTNKKPSPGEPKKGLIYAEKGSPAFHVSGVCLSIFSACLKYIIFPPKVKLLSSFFSFPNPIRRLLTLVRTVFLVSVYGFELLFAVFAFHLSPSLV
jgi:hypothetical protein